MKRPSELAGASCLAKILFFRAAHAPCKMVRGTHTQTGTIGNQSVYTLIAKQQQPKSAGVAAAAAAEAQAAAAAAAASAQRAQAQVAEQQHKHKRK